MGLSLAFLVFVRQLMASACVNERLVGKVFSDVIPGVACSHRRNES